MANEELTLYSDEPNQIWVTSSRFIIGNTTYPVRNVSSCSLQTVRDSAEQLSDSGFLGVELLHEEFRRLQIDREFIKPKKRNAILFSIVFASLGMIFSTQVLPEILKVYDIYPSESGVPLIIAGLFPFLACGLWAILEPKPLEIHHFDAFKVVINTAGNDVDAVSHISGEEIDEIHKALIQAMTDIR